jgi:DNA-binding NarL/FixJ family response regulator
MQQRKARVIVFSTATLFRQGLCSMLEDSGQIERVEGAGVWDSVVRSVGQHLVDAVVLDRDGTMPPSFLDDLFGEEPRLRIVLVSSSDNRLAVFTQSSMDGLHPPQLIAAVAAGW